MVSKVVERSELHTINRSGHFVASEHPDEVNRIVNGRSAVTADMALRLGAALGTTADFWLNAQKACDLYRAARAAGPLPELLVQST